MRTACVMNSKVDLTSINSSFTNPLVNTLSFCAAYDLLFFFFQAEDGIRDYKVTGVQTCALPIYPVADAVRDARRYAARQVVAGGAIDPPPRHRVPLVEVREQHRDVGRIVLQVGIHDHHPPALRRLESGVGRRRLTAVRLESHQTHPPVGLAKRANDLRAPVAAAVVDEHDLEGEPEALEHLAQLGPERGEAGFLVVDRDDDREVSHPAPPTRRAGQYPAIQRRASAGD